MFALYKLNSVVRLTIAHAAVTYLHVSVKNFAVMQRLETAHYLNEDVPDLLLFDVSFAFLVTANLLENVTVIGVLHDETKQINNLSTRST